MNKNSAVPFSPVSVFSFPSISLVRPCLAHHTKSANMQSAWQLACTSISCPEPTAKSWLCRISEAHRGDAAMRNYHNLAMLHTKFDLLQSTTSFADAIRHSAALTFAICFQYYEHDVSRECSDENCNTFRQFYAECNADDNALLATVCFLLGDLSSSTSSLSDIEALSDLFRDLDLAVFGASAKAYDEYAEQLLAEYGHADGSHFRSMRLKLLQTLLTIPSIYTTDEFRLRFEAAARSNIQREIEELKKS